MFISIKKALHIALNLPTFSLVFLSMSCRTDRFVCLCLYKMVLLSLFAIVPLGLSPPDILCMFNTSCSYTAYNVHKVIVTFDGFNCHSIWQNEVTNQMSLVQGQFSYKRICFPAFAFLKDKYILRTFKCIGETVISPWLKKGVILM